MEALKAELKNLIITTLNLEEDVKVNEISDSMPLFGEGLGLDSIDALELGVAIKKEYGIEIKGEENQKHFHSVESIAKFIKA